MVNQLTDKELYCLAWHYNIFYEQAKHEQIANWGIPCNTCKYNTECFETGKAIHLDMEDKLPVQITRHKHEKDIFSFGTKEICDDAY